MLSEDEDQIVVVDWLDYMGLLYYAVPNGGKRPIQTAARLKRTGLRAGVPDLVICEPTRSYAGLYIEMKRKSGGLISVKQKWWIEQLNLKGYRAIVCKGADEATDEIKKYLLT